MGTFAAVEPPATPPTRVVAVCSNKGGVGKTTVATNLAIYARALHDDLPVLLLGLDDQSVIDRMFRIQPRSPLEPNLKHVFARASLAGAVQLGQYGVSFVPPPPETVRLKRRVAEPHTLARLLQRQKSSGLVILDCKSDLEALTENAMEASDLIVLPIADQTSLEEAEKVFSWLESRGSRAEARCLLTLVDGRTRVGEEGLGSRLAEELDRRGRPRFGTHLSRSPRIEALNSASRNPGSILHHARGTQVHGQMRAFTEELLRRIGLVRAGAARAPAPAAAVRPASGPQESSSLKRALLRGLRAR